MDKVVHFELPATDLDRAQKFYGETFGWGLNEVPEMHYTLVQTGPADEQGVPTEAGNINGGMMQRSEAITAPVITINVDDIDRAADRIEDHGGTILLGKTPVGEMGFSAYFKDTEDNVVGLWQNPA